MRIQRLLKRHENCCLVCVCVSRSAYLFLSQKFLWSVLSISYKRRSWKERRKRRDQDRDRDRDRDGIVLYQ